MPLFNNENIQEALSRLIKIGEVSSVDYAAGTARVAFDDDDSLVSFDLQVLHNNTIANKDYAMPDVGEDVICLFLPSGTEGFILGSVYAGEITPPETSGAKRTVEFSDGTRISYDRETNQLDVQISGTTISANKESVKVNTPVSVDITGAQTVKVDTQGAVLITGAGSAKITSPTITLEGNVIINGAVTVSGDVVSGGKSYLSHTHTGNEGKPTSAPL